MHAPRRVDPGFASLAVSLLLGTIPAQDAQLVETGDGSRFLLVPLQTRVVHWINLQPAVSEIPGLAVAVARASLLGSTGPITENPQPLAWEKALRRAPSSGSRLVEVASHIGVSVTFPAESLHEVAQLLLQRTHREKLLEFPQHLTAARHQRRERIASIEHLALARRLLAQAEGGRFRHFLEPDDGEEIADAAVMRYYRHAYAPARAINVITGGFEPETLARVLRQMFRNPPSPAEASKQSAGDEPTAEKPVADGPPTQRETLFLGLVSPRGKPDELALLAEYLGGEDGFVVEHLRAAGHPNASVRVLAPFPAPGGMLVLVITDPGTKLTEDAPLLRQLREALDRAAIEPPQPRLMTRAAAVLRGRRSARLGDPQGLALLLAERWANSGEPPRGDLAAEARIGSEDLQAFATTVLAGKNRITILPRAKR